MAAGARTIDEKELCHELLGERFATALSNYDTQRRVETLVDEFLPDDVLQGAETLDVGCGLGFFSQRLAQRGARVTACDLGPSLVDKTVARAGCRGVVADALRLTNTFGAGAFDVVVSSECIEHTPDPVAAVREMARVVKPGGWISLSTPNLLWSPVVKAATWLKLRPFDGLENFSTWRSLRRTLRDEGVEIVREHGLHLFPFQFRLYRLSRWFDRRAQACRGLMINICLLGRKVEGGEAKAESG